jgi:hypothetical protein
MTEGETRLYRNNNAFPRVLFMGQLSLASSKQEAMEFLFKKTVDLRTHAVVELPKENEPLQAMFSKGQAEILSYKNNTITIATLTQGKGFLTLFDTYYPTWKAYICNKKHDGCEPTAIYRTDYNFRGVIVPEGEHIVEFKNTLW